jgi:E3 ubiquitin-protein ligase RNF13
MRILPHPVPDVSPFSKMVDVKVEELPVHTFYKDAIDPKIKDGDKIECQICLMDYQTGDQIKTLVCTHMFHKQCAIDWLNKKPSKLGEKPPGCPICKAEMKRPAF